MAALALDPTWWVLRRVFRTWSIHIPASFEERFVAEGNYWHAWDDDRSVSLTSFVLGDERGAPGAREILDQFEPEVLTPNGKVVDAMPDGLLGWATIGPIDQPARASQALVGVLAMDGRALLGTITSEDLAWAREVWLSIRGYPDGIAEGADITGTSPIPNWLRRAEPSDVRLSDLEAIAARCRPRVAGAWQSRLAPCAGHHRRSTKRRRASGGGLG